MLFSHLEMVIPPLALFVILASASFRVMPLFLIWPPLFYPGLEKGAGLWLWSTVPMRAVVAAGAVLVILLVGAPIVLCMIAYMALDAVLPGAVAWRRASRWLRADT